jgi:3-oxoacyl-[acyl-carrier protein] reductase
MDLGLRSKVALVSAASQGLGKACAYALAAEGSRLVICSRREIEIIKTAEEIAGQTGAEVVPVVADVANADDVKRFVDTAMERFGTVHVLVNNAGGPPPGDILSLKDADWEKAFNLTLMSMVRMTRAVLPAMIKQNWGRIITITSLSAKQPINELLLSSTFRPGISGLTRVVSNVHAANNITANTVCPGYILTKRQEEVGMARAGARNITFEEYLAESAKAIPTGRLGRPGEIGSVVAFLASEQASYINGENLLVDGGLAKGIH